MTQNECKSILRRLKLISEQIENSVVFTPSHPEIAERRIEIVKDIVVLCYRIKEAQKIENLMQNQVRKSIEPFSTTRTGTGLKGKPLEVVTGSTNLEK